jgi:hypothetical protein
VELLVGLVLMTIVAGGAYGLLRTTVRSWDGAEARADDLARQRTVEQFLRRHIEQAANVMDGVDDAARLAFEGEASRLRLWSELPAYLGGGLYEVIFALETHDDRERLVAHYRPAPPDEEEAEARVETSVLLDDLQELQFEYYGPSEPGAEPEWLSQWQDALQLPTLVRVRWGLLDAESWPEILVAPRSDAAARVPRVRPEGQPGPDDDADGDDSPGLAGDRPVPGAAPGGRAPQPAQR